MKTDTFDVDAFKAGLNRDGYTDISTKSMEADLFIDTHTHPFDVRAVVLEGEVTLNCDGEIKHLKAGDTLELARDIPHTEQYGPNGYTFLVGRRHP